MILYYTLAVLIIGLDQLTKYLTVSTIPFRETVEWIPNVLSFTHHRNTGAAWGILEGQMLFFYIVTVVVVGVVIYYLHTLGKQDILIGLSLSTILGGAIGNFIDRLIQQYVVDMIKLDFINFPIFNIADIALSVGVGLMIVYLVIDEIRNHKKKVGQ